MEHICFQCNLQIMALLEQVATWKHDWVMCKCNSWDYTVCYAVGCLHSSYWISLIAIGQTIENLQNITVEFFDLVCKKTKPHLQESCSLWSSVQEEKPKFSLAPEVTVYKKTISHHLTTLLDKSLFFSRQLSHIIFSNNLLFHDFTRSELVPYCCLFHHHWIPGVIPFCFQCDQFCDNFWFWYC